MSVQESHHYAAEAFTFDLVDTTGRYPDLLTGRSVQDLCFLKQTLPSAHIKHGDISPHIRQNCDAKSRVLTQTTIDELQRHIPGLEGTQLYLQAAVWTHTPYRNDKLGSLPAIVRSLWAGIMTWRRWWQYIIITSEMTLSQDHII